MSGSPIILKTMSDYAAAASAAGSVLSTVINNEYANYRTERDRQQNYQYNEKAAENADKRTRALYNDFYSPAALKRQYEEAGLSPSLMFGGTPGQGGTSGAQGGGPNGPQTPFMPLSLVDAAQAAALFAQASKTKAETKTINGENERGAAEIQKLLADAGQAEASKAYVEAQTRSFELQNYITEQTTDFSIQTAKYLAQRTEHEAMTAFWGAQDAKLTYDFNSETYQKRVEEVGKRVEQLGADILLKGAQKELTEEQKKQVTNSIAQAWEQLRLEGEKIAVMKTSVENQKAYWDKAVALMEQSLTQQMEIFGKQLTFEYVNMGVKAVTSIIQAAVGGSLLKGVVGKLFQGKGDTTPTDPGTPAPENTSFF